MRRIFSDKTKKAFAGLSINGVPTEEAIRKIENGEYPEAEQRKDHEMFDAMKAIRDKYGSREVTTGMIAFITSTFFGWGLPPAEAAEMAEELSQIIKAKLIRVCEIQDASADSN